MQTFLNIKNILALSISTTSGNFSLTLAMFFMEFRDFKVPLKIVTIIPNATLPHKEFGYAKQH